MKILGFFAVAVALSVTCSAHAQSAPSAANNADCQPTDTTCLQLQHANKVLERLSLKMDALQAQITALGSASTGRKGALDMTFPPPGLRATDPGSPNKTAKAFCTSVGYANVKIIATDADSGGWPYFSRLLCFD